MDVDDELLEVLSEPNYLTSLGDQIDVGGEFVEGAGKTFSHFGVRVRRENLTN